MTERSAGERLGALDNRVLGEPKRRRIPWRLRLLLVVGLSVVGAAIGYATSSRTLDPNFANDVAKGLSERLGDQTVKLTCPSDIPMKAGRIADCVADLPSGRKYVRITQDDDQGHYHWLLTSQDAP